MKKMKKFFAVLLALAMVLGMSATAFATKVTNKYTNDINVTNLAEGVETKVQLLNIIYLDETDGNQSWHVVDWADKYITVNDTANGVYSIKDKNGLYEAAKTASLNPENVTMTNDKVSGTETKFTGVPVGAYVVYAQDEAGIYSLMVANTYDKNGGTYMATKTADVTAKLEKYNVTKATSDEFVHRGQEVTFTVTTQMAPKSNDAGATLNNFKVVDKPVNLKVTDLTAVSVSGNPVTEEQLTAIKAAVTNKIDSRTGCTTEYVVDLASLIESTSAGATIQIQYKAIVMSDTDYSNEATVTADTVTYEPGRTNGTEGAITIKKTDKDGNSLNGAEFKLFKVKDDGTKEEVSVIRVSDGVYRHALSDETAAETMVVANDGTLLVKGLDEGKYSFQETKAPEGYKLVDTPSDAKEITNGNTETVDAGNFINTKLSALPSTGGIGTTIFTIAGCAIMIAAAGFFFASRKKANK